MVKISDAFSLTSVSLLRSSVNTLLELGAVLVA